jgi:hypothetical protein
MGITRRTTKYYKSIRKMFTPYIEYESYTCYRLYRDRCRGKAYAEGM